MGYGSWQRLVRIELPLALPLIIAGIRVAVVTVIGIATVAAFIDAGGLGTIILMGIDQSYTEKILVGGALTASLATFFDITLSYAEKALLRRQRMAP
jgi:osmoprotectant transport system permease protein